jgi:LCP family protein required for cell wall assembly
MKKILLFPISLLLFLAFFVSHSQAESIVPDGVEHTDSYDVVMDINADSTIHVTETINYDFGTKTKPGISRYIPLDYQNLSGASLSINVSDVTVADENGNQCIFNHSRVQSDDKKKSYQEIDIGDAGQPVSGMKTYVIRYTVSDSIKHLADHDELFWDITGDKWPVYVKHPEVKINLPQEVAGDKVSKECFIGQHAATIGCIDRIGSTKNPNVDYSYKGVVSGEGMTVVYGFPKNIVQEKSAAQQNFWNVLRNNRWMQGIFLLAISLLVAIIILVKLYFKKIAEFFSWEKWSKALMLIREKIKLYHTGKIKNKSKKWWIVACIVLIIIFISGGIIFWKIENIINKISVKGESVGSIVHASIDNQSQIKGESDGRINILLLGILGANHPGGGLNTDTIMVASIEPKENKISLVSIPRDLWVTDPGKDTKSKINAVYAYGEEKGPGRGITDMEDIISEITGLPIHYAVVGSTAGFAEIVDTLGGVEIVLSKPFDESAQFEDIQVCDSDTYTIPTGDFQDKKKKGKIVARYPLCKNKNPECGGNFHLPAGKNILNGQQSLCFVRSRYLTNDFERAKRQQLILEQLKQKANQLGLIDFGKINSILNNLGGNVRTDMQLWEMRRLFDLYKQMNNPKIYQRVLEDSKEGLLYSPDSTPETGFILLPRDDNYDKIKNLFQNIFSTASQSDIKPEI